MKKSIWILLALWSAVALAQTNHKVFKTPALKSKPTLVIGIVVDQMKWDYLSRFRTSSGGLGKMLQEGFECSNTRLNYLPTVTAIGHSAIYTGAVPAFSGIVGNNWYDRRKKEVIYCTQGAHSEMSPENLWASTITDELKLASDFKSKVYGVSLKDRGAILPAGHIANAAFWWDGKKGTWTTSASYYAKEEAQWINAYNAKALADAYYKRGWVSTLPLEQYRNAPYAKKPYYSAVLGTGGFPYRLDQFIDKDYSKILSTPGGNKLTIDLAKKIIDEKKLGRDATTTDFLAISFSSTDYVGHAFGPHSIELEDMYLSLDKDLGEFLNYVEQSLGENVLVFLSADHGVAEIQQFSKEHQLPGTDIQEEELQNTTNAFLRKTFHIPTAITHVMNAQLYLSDSVLIHPQKTAIIETLERFLLQTYGDEIVFVVDNHSIPNASIPTSLKEQITNGYTPTRSGDITLIFRAGSMPQHEGKGTTHFAPYNYDRHIPLLFYGWKIPKGFTSVPMEVVDIAPTLSSLLDVPTPNATVGVPIQAILQRIR